MKHLLTIFTTALILIACDADQKSELTSQDKSWVEKPEPQKASLDFARFRINKGSIGQIRIGMTMSEADNLLKDLERKEYESTVLGFDGGSPAFLYSYNDEPILATVSSLESDSILFLIAYHEKLKTLTGIHPGMIVKELIKIYPNLMVKEDLLNEWEYATDSLNNWNFIFSTDENTQVGEYPGLEVPSKPKKLDTKMDWINIE